MVSPTDDMEWHDKTCRRFDRAVIGDLVTCMSCGSCKFQYPPIKQRTDLRLLRVYPGNFDDPLRCDIFTTNVDTADFEAISYTWADESGDSCASSSILLNSTQFPVTRNCEMALKRVRERVIIRHIWIDAVCIDQANDDERGHQVRLMPQIYSRARSVLVYIGEAAKMSSWTLKTLASGPQTHLEPKDQDMLGKGIHHLVSRRYFSRVWVLQEIALARNASLICGDTVVPWKCLRPPHFYSSGTPPVVSELSLHCRLPPVLRLDHSAYTQPDKFLDLLDFASECKAEDPRDRVYSLLGLVIGPLSQSLEVDYTLSAEQVFVKTAHLLGRHFGWSAILRHALARGRNLPDLPSWVPDWTSRRGTVILPAQSPEAHLLEPLQVTPEALVFQVLRTRQAWQGWVYGQHNNTTGPHLVRADLQTLHLPLAQNPLQPTWIGSMPWLSEDDLAHGAFLRFPEGAPLFDLLSRNMKSLHGHKYLRTASMVATYKRGRDDVPPSADQELDTYEISGDMSLWSEMTWTCLSTTTLQETLNVCVGDLVEMLSTVFLLPDDGSARGLVIPLVSTEWRSVVPPEYGEVAEHTSVLLAEESDIEGSFPETVGVSYDPQGFLAHVVRRLQESSGAPGAAMSTDVVAKMVGEFLEANFLLEFGKVNIV
ncbi:heterokaryon incompatibility protein-domain-containing protein [Podospora aff. communis PSN243]|uniref:Heterokaryon incompatibility protein-domain-containing protein n=1 Tax=Podospora aff. communis PSN243 TaxID=3040156 RepID=A0AAV9GP53_9PEZI|nr:heterokaryon incompatibility protein-domain-containing protein [Podospora aff. communis PSN243]